MNKDLGQIDLICEIYKKNLNLIEQIDEELINKFISLIVLHGRQRRFLVFFDSVLFISGQPVIHLQKMILKSLTSQNLQNYLLYMNSFSNFEFFENFLDGKVDQPFDYHEILISVLGKCGFSYTEGNFYQKKCQNLLSIPVILELLSKKNEFSKLHVPLMDFAINVYLESGKNEEISKNSFGFLDFFERKTKEIEEKSLNSKFFLKFIEFIQKYYKNLSESDYPVIPDIKEQVIALQSRLNKLNFEVPAESNMINIKDFQRSFINTSQNIHNSLSNSENSLEKAKWDQFIQDFSLPIVKKYIKKEQVQFYSIFNKENEYLDKTIVIQNLIKYLSMSQIYNPSKEIIYLLLRFLGYYSKKPTKHEKESKIEAKIRAANELKDLKLVSVILNLFCQENLEKKIFSALISLSNKLLKEGNEKVQEEFFYYFLSFPESERFFSRLHRSIFEFTNMISTISNNERVASSKFRKSSKIISKIMKFLQKLCENHNKSLQNYIRNQYNSRNNYDLVSSVIVLLNELIIKKHKKDFLIISQCFDTLTEFVQGPCRPNQKLMINSQFLETANDLLSINDYHKKLVNYATLPSSNLEKNYFDKSFLKGKMVSVLKYKCLITLLGFLEAKTNNFVILRMSRVLNMQMIKENLISVYGLYSKDFMNQFYDDQIFGRFEVKCKNFTNLKNSKPLLIIEVGFMFYHLICYFYELKDPELNKKLEIEFPGIGDHEIQSIFTVKILKNIGKLGKNALNLGKVVISKLLKTASVVSDKEKLRQPLQFFSENTKSIEIIFKGSTKKIFF